MLKYCKLAFYHLQYSFHTFQFLFAFAFLFKSCFTACGSSKHMDKNDYGLYFPSGSRVAGSRPLGIPEVLVGCVCVCVCLFVFLSFSLPTLSHFCNGDFKDSGSADILIPNADSISVLSLSLAVFSVNTMTSHSPIAVSKSCHCYTLNPPVFLLFFTLLSPDSSCFSQFSCKKADNVYVCIYI